MKTVYKRFRSIRHGDKPWDEVYVMVPTNFPIFEGRIGNIFTAAKYNNSVNILANEDEIMVTNIEKYNKNWISVSARALTDEEKNT